MDAKSFTDGIDSGNITASVKTTVIQPVPNERRLLTVSQNRWNPSSGEVIDPITVEIDIDAEERTLANLIDRKTALLAEISVHQAYVDDLNAVYNA